MRNRPSRRTASVGERGVLAALEAYGVKVPPAVLLKVPGVRVVSGLAVQAEAPGGES